MNYTNTLRHVFAALAVLGVVTLASTARASSITYTLTEDGCSGGCGTAPYGTITLTNDTSLANTVDVSETLFNGDELLTTGAHNALTFNTDVPITATDITDLTTGYTFVDSPSSNPPFGTFDYGITCSGCGPGASKPVGGTLSFDVTGPSGFSISDFDANGGGTFFASDIIGTTGNTGAVGADKASAVPEPSQTFLLLALMLVGFVAMRRSKLRSTR
jgi:hypothetical protein